MKTKNYLKIIIALCIILLSDLNVQAQNPNCENCTTFPNANVYTTLITNSLTQVSPDDCNTFQICFPVISEDCDITARINWGDDSPLEEINSTPGNPGDISDCIEHTYASTNPEQISISIVLNGSICQTSNNIDVPFAATCQTDCNPCNSTPFIFVSQPTNCNYSFISLHEVDDCAGLPDFSWSFTNSNITTSTAINPTVTPIANGPLTATLTLTYTLPDGSQCSVSNSRTTNITCIEVPECPTCSEALTTIIDDIIGPLACGSYLFPVQSNLDDCYDIFVTPGDGSAPVQISAGSFNIINYTQNGTYTALVTIGVGTSVCSEKVEFIVDCFDECPDCEQAGSQILNSITTTNFSCTAFNIFVPEEITNCYSAFYDLSGTTGLNLIPLSPGANFVGEPVTGSILIALFDENGRCYTDKISDADICPTRVNTSGNMSSKQKIITSPNPFRNNIGFKNNGSQTIKTIEIYNYFGQKIANHEYSLGDQVEVPVGIPGLYFAKVFFNNGEVQTISIIRK